MNKKLESTKRWLKDNIKINLIEIMCDEIFEKIIVYVYIYRADRDMFMGL
jgi:hypothetical protein